MQWSHATILLGLCLACAAQRGSRRFNADQPLEESLSVQNHRFQGRSRSDGVEDVTRGSGRGGRTQDTTEENHRSLSPRSRSKPEDAPRTFHSRRQEVPERPTSASLEGRSGRFESQTNSRARNQNVEQNRGRGRTETIKEPTRSAYEVPNASKLGQKPSEANNHESTKSISGQNRANIEQDSEKIQELSQKSNVPEAILQNADSVTDENSPKIQQTENNERIEEYIKSPNPISQDTFTEASQQRQSNRDETKTKQLEEHSGRHSKTEDVRRKNSVSGVSDRTEGTLPRNELTNARRRGGDSPRRVGSFTRKNVIDEPKSDTLESTRRVDSFVRRNKLDESERSREDVPRRTDSARRRNGEESRRNDEANPRKFHSFPSRSRSQDTTSDAVENSRTPDSIPRRGRLLGEPKENRENPRRVETFTRRAGGGLDEPRPSGVEPSRRTEFVSRRSGSGDVKENRGESFTRRGSEDRKGVREEGTRRVDASPRQTTSIEPREKQLALPRYTDAFPRSGIHRRVDLLPKNRKVKEPIQNGLVTEFPKRSNDVEESTRASRKLDSDLSTTVKSNTVVDLSTRNSILEDPNRRLEASLSKDSEPSKRTSEDRRPIYSRGGAATREGKESINQDSPQSRRTQGFRSRSKEDPVQPALGEARKRADFSPLNRSRDRFTSRPTAATNPDANTTPETISSSVPELGTEGGIEEKNEITIPSSSETIYATIDRAPATVTAAGTLPRRPNRGRGHFTPSKDAGDLVLMMWRNATVAHQLKVSESQSVTLEKIKRKPKIINKKENSGEVKDDDNYPEVYKQLKKSGSDPKEILALLKARKEAREKIAKTKNNIPQIDASRKPSLPSKKEIDEDIKTERTTESRALNPRTNYRRKSNSDKSEIETEKTLSNQSKYTTSSPDLSGKINRNGDEIERKSKFRSSNRFKTDREISPRPELSERNRGLYRKRTETFNSNNKDGEDQNESQSSYRRRNRYINNESKTITNNNINDKLNNNHNIEQEIKNEETNDEESQTKEKKPFEDSIKAQILRHKTLKQEERHKFVPKNEIHKKLYSSKYRADKETTEEIATVATYTERVKATYVPRNRNRDYEKFKLRTEKPVDFVSVETPIRPKYDLYKRKDQPSFQMRSHTTERTQEISTESTYQLGQFVPKSRPTYVPPKRKYGKATTPTSFSRYRDRKTSLSKILNSDDDLKLDNSEDHKLTVDYEETEEDVRPNIKALSIHSLVTESSQSTASTESSVMKRNRSRYSGSHIQRVPPKKKSDVTTILPMTTLYQDSENGDTITQDLEQATGVESSTFGNSGTAVASESSENEDELLTISTTEPTTTTTSTTTTARPTTRTTTKPKLTTRQRNKPTTRKVTTKATTTAKTTTTTPPSTTTTQPTTTTTEPITLPSSIITTTTTEATTPLTKKSTTTATMTTTKTPTTITTTSKKPTTTSTPTTKKPTITTTKKPNTTTTTKKPTSTTSQPATTSQKPTITTTTKKPTPKTTKKPVATTTTKKKVETPTSTIRTSTTQSTTLVPGILPRIGNPSTIENEIPLNFDIVTPTTYPTFLSTIAYLARNFTPTPTTIPNLVNTADIRTTTSPPENTSTPRGNYVVYGLLPNNNVVRKVIRTTPAPVDLPFIIYGLYPNGTIVRRFPNGTILPDETEEEENEIIASVEPGSQESLEDVVKKDNPLSYLYPLGGSSPTTPKTVYIPSTLPSTLSKETSTVPSIDISFDTSPLNPLTTASVTLSSTIGSNVKATSAGTTPKPSLTTARKPPPTTKPSTTTSKRPTTIKPVVRTTAKQKSSKSTTKSATTTIKTTTTTKPATTAKPTTTTPKPTTTTTTTPKPTTTITTTPKPTTAASVKLSTAKTTVHTTTKRITTPSKPKTTTAKAKTQATTPKTTTTTSKSTTSPIAKSQATPTTIRTTTKSSTTPVAKSQATSTTIRTTTNKSKNSNNGKNKPKTTKEPLSDAEILNSLVKQGAIGNIPISTTENSIDLADKVIKLAIERAQKSTSSSLLQDPADLQTLSSTALPVTKTVTGESVNSTDASQGTNRTGKISVWIIPPEEGNSTNRSETGSTISPTENELLASLLASPNAIDNLPLQEQILLAEVLSSTTFPQTTKKKKKKRPKTTTTTTPPPPFPVLQYIFGRNRGGGGLFQGGLLRGLALRGLTSGDTPQESQPTGIFQSDSTASSQNIETSTEPQQEGIQQNNGLVGAAINVSRAVSQFMGFVIQGAAQSFQNYLQTRTRALAEALANPPPVS